MEVALHERAIFSGCDLTSANHAQEHKKNVPWGHEPLMKESHLPLVPIQQGRPLILQSMCL